MKKFLLKLAFALTAFCFSSALTAQTAGTLTFTFSPVAKAPCYSGSQNVLAAWIQTNAGTFVKTKLAYAGCCSSCCCTYDHLPTWSANAGGVASDCMNANVTDATTGATLSGFTPKSFVWDGKNVSGTSNGTLVADGIYKVVLQETWNHGTGTAMTSYTFTKGPSADVRTITGDANFGNISINWQPSVTTGINDVASISPAVNVYPNPTTGVFTVNFSNATNIKVMNTLGKVVYEEKVDKDSAESTKSIDMTQFANGIYLINVSNETGSSNQKIQLNK